MTTDRCPQCDRPLATEADAYHCTMDGGSLCWSAYDGKPCAMPPIDWRARATEAERSLETLRRAFTAGEEARAGMESRALEAERKLAAAQADAERLAIALAEARNFLEEHDGGATLGEALDWMARVEEWLDEETALDAHHRLVGESQEGGKG